MTRSDRRVHPRFRYPVKAILVVPPFVVVDVTIIDLSLSGAKIIIDGHRVVQIGRKCSLHIVSPEGRKLQKIEASAANRNAEGQVGLVWGNLTPGADKILRKIVNAN
jgi:hypothetical protein